MIEELLFNKLTMNGEFARIAIALLGTLIGAYYDIFNRRNVPNNFLYAFLIVAVLVNLLFFDIDIITYALAIGAIIGGIGYVLYKIGYIGGADVFVMASLAILLPIAPAAAEMSINYPFILFILIFAFVSSALYLFVYFALKLSKEKKINADKRYLLLVLPYLVILYMITTLPFFSPAFFFILSATLLLSVFFMTYKETLNRMMAQKVPIGKVEEEDILALEFMDKDLVWKHKLQRLVNAEELKRLKKLKIKDIMVYTKLPAFLPFVFIGLVIALVASRYLLLV